MEINPNTVGELTRERDTSYMTGVGVWNTKLATSQANDVLPPQPSVLQASNAPFTNNPINPRWGLGPYPLWKIDSNRQPFATQYMINRYHGLQTGLGTNIGS